MSKIEQCPDLPPGSVREFNGEPIPDHFYIYAFAYLTDPEELEGKIIGEANSFGPNQDIYYSQGSIMSRAKSRRDRPIYDNLE